MARRRSSPTKASKKYKIELTPLSILLWVGGLFFVLSWIFVLGILVGRGYLPGAVTAISDIGSRISTLEEMVSSNRSSDLASPKESESDPKLTFFDELSSKREEAKEERTPKRSVKGKESQRQREALRPMNKNRDQKQVVVSQKAQPNQSLPRIADAQYTVQLASFGEKSRAEKMINDLVGRGYLAYYYEGKVKGKTYHRVRCGIFPRRKAAEDYAEKLLREEGIKGLVIRIEWSHD